MRTHEDQIYVKVVKYCTDGKNKGETLTEIRLFRSWDFAILCFEKDNGNYESANIIITAQDLSNPDNLYTYAFAK